MFFLCTSFFYNILYNSITKPNIGINSVDIHKPITKGKSNSSNI